MQDCKRVDDLSFEGKTDKSALTLKQALIRQTAVLSWPRYIFVYQD